MKFLSWDALTLQTNSGSLSKIHSHVVHFSRGICGVFKWQKCCLVASQNPCEVSLGMETNAQSMVTPTFFPSSWRLNINWDSLSRTGQLCTWFQCRFSITMVMIVQCNPSKRFFLLAFWQCWKGEVKFLWQSFFFHFPGTKTKTLHCWGKILSHMLIKLWMFEMFHFTKRKNWHSWNKMLNLTSKVSC